MFDRELKKGSAELLILSLIEHTARHGYDIAQLIEARSDGVIQFKVASLYPLLYRLEARGMDPGTLGREGGDNADAAITASPRTGAKSWPRSAARGTRLPPRLRASPEAAMREFWRRELQSRLA
jgi:hypothetical protein